MGNKIITGYKGYFSKDKYPYYKLDMKTIMIKISYSTNIAKVRLVYVTLDINYNSIYIYIIFLI